MHRRRYLGRRPARRLYTSEVLDHLKAHHDELYSLFSRLLQTTFDDARPQFADGSVDVLHIDGHHSYDAVMHDFETWLPKLSRRGVVLMHDIEVRDRPGFAVWRFWDEVKQHYPHFAFHHSYGLGVLAVGRDIPEGLRPLLMLDADGQDAVRRYFANLGDHLEELHGVAVQRENLQELLDAKSMDCVRLEGDIVAAVAERDAARRQHARMRYRIVDKLARIGNRIPVLPGLLHAVAVAVVRLLRRVNRMISPRRD